MSNPLLMLLWPTERHFRMKVNCVAVQRNFFRDILLTGAIFWVNLIKSSRSCLEAVFVFIRCGAWCRLTSRLYSGCLAHVLQNNLIYLFSFLPYCCPWNLLLFKRHVFFFTPHPHRRKLHVLKRLEVFFFFLGIFIRISRVLLLSFARKTFVPFTKYY